MSDNDDDDLLQFLVARKRENWIFQYNRVITVKKLKKLAKKVIRPHEMTFWVDLEDGEDVYACCFQWYPKRIRVTAYIRYPFRKTYYHFSAFNLRL